MINKVDGLAAYKKSFSGEAKENYDNNFERIFGKRKIPHGGKIERVGNVVIKETGIKVKGGDGSKEDQRRFFKNDIVQPYTEKGKINGDFIKIYGKENHPAFKKDN